MAEAVGVLTAPLERVAAEALRVDVGPAGRRRVGLFGDFADVRGGPARFRVVAPHHAMTVDLDAADHSIAVQGGWWYRGEYRLRQHPHGTLVRHRVYNVAGWSKWAVPLANRLFIGFDVATQAALTSTLADLAERLECEVRAA